MALFRAAAIETDLEPWPGVWMTGYGARVTPAVGTHDSIMARTLMMKADSMPLVIVTCDLLGLGTTDVNEIRERIHRQTGIPGSAIMISGTHTHSGPATQHQRGVMGMVDADWLKMAKDKIVDAVCRLPERLEPATFSHAKSRIECIGYNRADSSRPIDEDIVVFSVDSWAGPCIATVINYAMHAVTMGPTNLMFSGDYPGAACRKLAETRGGIGLFLAGAGGNIDPVINRDRGWGKGSFEDVEATGAMFADKANRLLENAEKTCAVKIKSTSKTVDMPMASPISNEELDNLIAEYETAVSGADINSPPPIETAMLIWANELKQAKLNNTVPKTTPVEVFAAKINDLNIVGVPVEAYSDIAQSVKEDLQPNVTAFVGYANGLYCYIPAKWEYENKGYASTAYRWFEGMMSGFCEDADTRLIAAISETFSEIGT